MEKSFYHDFYYGIEKANFLEHLWMVAFFETLRNIRKKSFYPNIDIFSSLRSA